MVCTRWGREVFHRWERCIVNSCSSSNNYIKRTEHIFACVSLLSLIRKYCGQWCPPREWKHTQEKRVVKRRLMVGKRGTSWTRQCLRPARNFWFYIFICSLSHTQILIEFIVTTFMFVAFMFLSSLFVSMSKFYGLLWLNYTLSVVEFWDQLSHRFREERRRPPSS